MSRRNAMCRPLSVEKGSRDLLGDRKQNEEGKRPGGVVQIPFQQQQQQEYTGK